MSGRPTRRSGAVSSLHLKRTLVRGLTPWWAAALAGAAIACWLLMLSGSYLTYAERASGDAARLPVPAAAGTPYTRWSPQTDALADGQTFSVILLDPVGPAAPWPTGVPRLQPGQVALSPELARDGAGEGIERRYGTTAGVIGRQGLTAPDERIAYARPRNDRQMSSRSLTAGRFGGYEISAWAVHVPLVAPVGESAHIRGLLDFWLVATALVGLPALALAWALSSACSRRRERRILVMRALGATAGECRRLVLRSAWGGATVGAGLTAVAAFLLALTGARLPLTSYRLSDVIVSPVTLAAPALALLVTLALFIRLPRPRVGVRPTVVVTATPAWHLLLGPALLLFSLWFPEDITADWAALVRWILPVVTTAALGLTAAAAAVGAGAGIRRLGRRLRRGQLVVAGSWLAHGHRRLAPLCLGIVLPIGLAFQAAGLGLLLAQPQDVPPAPRTAKVSVVEGPPGQVTALLSTLQRDLVPFAVSRGEGGPPSVVATCPRLREVGFTCRDGAVERPGSEAARDALRITSFHEVARVSVGIPTMPADGALAVVSPRGSLDRPALDQRVRSVLSPRFDAVSPDEDGSAGPAFAVRWVLLLGLIGLALCVLAVRQASAEATGLLSREVGGVARLYGRPRVSALWAGAAIAIPVLLAGGTGIATGLILTDQLRGDTSHPEVLDQLSTWLCLGVAVAAVLAGAEVARRSICEAAVRAPGHAQASG